MDQFEESFIPSTHRFSAANPLANCLKTGTSADFPRIPEDVQAVNNRALDWYKALTPQNYYHCWLVDQVALTSIKIEHTNSIERRERDRIVLRSELFWDDERRLAAEDLGETLAKAPAQVVNKLRRTPQGCDWLIERWARLARIADLAKVANTWDQAQTSLAWDLLGTRAEDRTGVIGEVIDHYGKVVSSNIGVAELARREVDALLKRKEEVAGLDTLDRGMTEADYLVTPTPEIRQINRQNAELHRRLKWYTGQIRAKSLYPATKPGVYDFYHDKLGSVLEKPAQAATPPAPIDPTTESSPIPAPRIATDEFDENGNTWQYLVNARRDAEELKKQAREEARMEKRMRLRA